MCISNVQARSNSGEKKILLKLQADKKLPSSKGKPFSSERNGMPLEPWVVREDNLGTAVAGILSVSTTGLQNKKMQWCVDTACVDGRNLFESQNSVVEGRLVTM